MIVTDKELILIIYVLRNKAIGTAEYKRNITKQGLLLLLYQTLKSKSKTAKVEESDIKLIEFNFKKYLEVLLNISNLRMNEANIKNTIGLIRSVLTKIQSYDNKGSR